MFQKLKECEWKLRVLIYELRVARTALVHLNVLNPSFFSVFQYRLIAVILALAAISRWKLSTTWEKKVKEENNRGRRSC